MYIIVIALFAAAGAAVGFAANHMARRNFWRGAKSDDWAERVATEVVGKVFRKQEGTQKLLAMACGAVFAAPIGVLVALRLFL